jgi:Flp pilus assembly pilin Flp
MSRHPLTARAVTSSCRRTASQLGRLVGRLCREDDGQDLIEYVLLTGIIAIAGILIFPAMQDAMVSTYQDWNSNAQAIWEPPPPTGTP